jgi:tetratricopeptide (TPR) repeat protein
MPPATVRNLSDRRVPQYLAVYLGASWGLVQFIDFIGSRYGLSPRWTDLTLLAVGLLLPSVALYIYHHGRPGRDEWHPTEKLLIPLNVVLLAGVLTFVGAGSNLSAVMTRVSVTDEKGNTIEALVPNKAYRKRVAVFQFDAPSDTATSWLGFGVPFIVTEDLQQQNFVEIVPPTAMRDRMQKAGFADGAGVPLSLKRDITEELHVPYFVAGTVEKNGGQYVAKVQVYETRTARLLKETNLSAADVPALGDLVSAQLMKDLDIPVIADAAPDMPLTEVLTKNPAALRAYIGGIHAIVVREDWAAAAPLLEKAVQLDPTFASAHLNRFVVALTAGKPEQAQAAIQAALDHSYRMPQRTKEFARAYYYFVRQDHARAYAVLDMLAQLYPDDIQIHQQLAQINVIRDNKQAIIASFEKVLELDPTRLEVLQKLGDTYADLGDGDKALRYYRQYAAKSPDDPQGFRRIGNLQRRLGRHAEAKGSYEKALLVQPEDIDVLADLAILNCYLGDFDEAERKYEQAFAASKTPMERAKLHMQQAEFAKFRGEIATAVKHAEATAAEISKVQPSVFALITRIQMLSDAYPRVDALAAEQVLDEARTKLPAPFNMNLPVFEMVVYSLTDNARKLEPALAGVDALIKDKSFNYMKPIALRHRGHLHEMRDDCKTAIRWYEESSKLEPLEPRTDIGRCYRKLERRVDAEKELANVLRVQPANGEANYELGLLYKAAGDEPRARKHLQRALETWKGADRGFKPAQAARRELAQAGAAANDRARPPEL